MSEFSPAPAKFITYTPEQRAQYRSAADAILEEVIWENQRGIGAAQAQEARAIYSIPGSSKRRSNISRRSLLIFTAGATAAFVTAPVSIAKASPLSVPRGVVPWTSPHWFPKTTGHNGLPNMVDSLNKAGFHLAAKDHAQRVKYENRPDAGECPALAAAGLLENAPSDIKNAAKVAVLAELHRGVVALRMVNVNARLITLMQAGDIIAVDAPTGDPNEIWVRGAYGFDNAGQIAVTAFSAGHIMVPLSSIKTGWILKSYDDPASKASNVDKVFDRVRNQHLDPQIQNHVRDARAYAHA
jgi:hypothetical protein